MITGKDITLNDDGSRIVQIQSDSFTIQHGIDKDNQFDPMTSIIVYHLQDTKLVASYIMEMDGTRATFHRELGKIFHDKAFGQYFKIHSNVWNSFIVSVGFGWVV